MVKINIFMNGYYIATTTTNMETIKDLQANGFICEYVK